MLLHVKFREQRLAQSNRSTCEQLCWIRCSFDLHTSMCRHWVTGGVRGGRGQNSWEDRHALWQVKYAAEKETEKEVLRVGWLCPRSCLPGYSRSMPLSRSFQCYRKGWVSDDVNLPNVRLAFAQGGWFLFSNEVTKGKATNKSAALGCGIGKEQTFSERSVRPSVVRWAQVQVN